MRLITLNTWGGRITIELLDFLERNRKSTDIFCFQEIYHRATHVHVAQGGIDPDLTLLEDIEKALPEYQAYFRPHYLETYGLAAFVKKSVTVIEEDECFVHRQKGFMPDGEVGNHARNVQRITMQLGDEVVHVFNFHGLWNGKGKDDCEERIEQSKKLAQYIQGFEGKRILCGDFNLSPETESLRILEALPLRNLVKEYGVTSTRTPFYDKENKYADYILVSEDVKVIDFRVLPDVVSDHAPLAIEFES